MSDNSGLLESLDRLLEKYKAIEEYSRNNPTIKDACHRGNLRRAVKQQRRALHLAFQKLYQFEKSSEFSTMPIPKIEAGIDRAISAIANVAVELQILLNDAHARAAGHLPMVSDVLRGDEECD